MSKHTPGPWETDAEFGHESVLDAEGVTVADCAIFYRTRTVVENQANARLIAAAPDLLTELKRAKSTMEHMLADLETIAPKAVSAFSGRNELKEMTAAIAKAEGRS